ERLDDEFRAVVHADPEPSGQGDAHVPDLAGLGSDPLLQILQPVPPGLVLDPPDGDIPELHDLQDASTHIAHDVRIGEIPLAQLRHGRSDRIADGKRATGPAPRNTGEGY